MGLMRLWKAKEKRSCGVCNAPIPRRRQFAKFGGIIYTNNLG